MGAMICEWYDYWAQYCKCQHNIGKFFSFNFLSITVKNWIKENLWWECCPRDSEDIYFVFF